MVLAYWLALLGVKVGQNSLILYLLKQKWPKIPSSGDFHRNNSQIYLRALMHLVHSLRFHYCKRDIRLYSSFYHVIGNLTLKSCVLTQLQSFKFTTNHLRYQIWLCEYQFNKTILKENHYIKEILSAMFRQNMQLYYSSQMLYDLQRNWTHIYRQVLPYSWYVYYNHWGI